ncbi:unnamed protein product [Pylaiella littoralis]
MGRNYYEVLGLPKGTSDAAKIKKAYRKKALQSHPDRGGDKAEFQGKFIKISEAFEVLSDEKKKKLYDQFGEAGLGAGVGDAPGDGSGSAGTGMPFGASGASPFGPGTSHFSFSTTGGGGGRSAGGFQGSDPFSVFEAFFGTGNANEAGSGGSGAGEGFSSFPMAGMSGMQMGTSGGMPGGFGGGGGMPAKGGGVSRQAPPVEHCLNISLEELYRGSSKRMRITKKTPKGQAQVDKTITIKPGWKDGTKITYKEEGDEHPGMRPADVVFVIKTKPHPRFERDENNLICTVIITLAQALTGNPHVQLAGIRFGRGREEELRLGESLLPVGCFSVAARNETTQHALSLRNYPKLALLQVFCRRFLILFRLIWFSSLDPMPGPP